MFHFLSNKLRFWQILNRNFNKENDPQKLSQVNLSHDLKKNLKTLREILGTSDDIIIREFSFGHKGQINAALIFLEGMTDKVTINESIIKPLMYDSRFICSEETSEAINIDSIKNTMLSVGNIGIVTAIDELVDDCLSGDTILLINGSKEALDIHTKGWATRGVDEPKTEAVVRGPREAFSENLRTNTTLLRRKIKNPDLTLETMKLGKKTKTSICIAYLKGVANDKVVEEVRRRLKRIYTDAILESGYIEEFIEDAPFSIFSTVANSEKPDIVAAKLLEGRVAVLVDGTPFVLTVPMVFIEGFQSSEDYYSRAYFASLVRMLRFIAFTISTLGPAVYVALTTFHQELIPTALLFTMAANREGTPFPAILEAGMMMITFEILREAGVRLPRPVGQAISIVGALVIGESAVAAGLIGAPMVIVIAITAVSSFVVPSQTDAGVILRIILLILAGFMGGFGIAIGLLGILIHLASLRSFGTPYLSPVAPLTFRDLKDVFVRVPIWAMFTQPRAIAWHNSQRQEFRLKPKPPSKERDDR
ncbi:spore germination protein [Petroclostridium sp. X23]|uniref:spore germination protein n=1 Tax=Petroclostridium sp. X23 TaxID=3045146 RepID=UPI0024AE2883|nr:spore germination protein [Petroclostridium sp. X23]WHH58630.1 spore germination protein [Petroclostridium sp. X23]